MWLVVTDDCTTTSFAVRCVVYACGEENWLKAFQAGRAYPS
jgi:hypothetical protein